MLVPVGEISTFACAFTAVCAAVILCLLTLQYYVDAIRLGSVRQHRLALLSLARGHLWEWSPRSPNVDLHRPVKSSLNLEDFARAHYEEMNDLPAGRPGEWSLMFFGRPPRSLSYWKTNTALIQYLRAILSERYRVFLTTSIKITKSRMVSFTTTVTCSSRCPPARKPNSRENHPKG